MTWRDIEGWWEDEWLFRDAVAAAPDPAHFVEVGSWMGRSTACMAEAIRRSGKGIRFDQVDTFDGSPYGSHPQRIEILHEQGKTLLGEFETNLRDKGLWPYVNPVRKPSVEATGGYEDESLDLVFLDADHRANAVEADCRAWWPKIKPGGMLCGHDWPLRTNSPQGVRRGVEAAGIGEPQHRGMSWWMGKKGRQLDLSVRVSYPPGFPGVQRAWWYLRHGFRLLGCDVIEDQDLLELGYWSPPRTLPGPVHIAVLRVGETPIYYDCSDFVQSHPSLGTPYFAKNALESDCPPVIPIGQYLGTKPMTMLADLGRLRKLSSKKIHDGIAVFSNIDERGIGKQGPIHQAADAHCPQIAMRRALVERLNKRETFVTGLWRWNQRRPEIPVEIDTKPVPYQQHWMRVAHSRLVFCPPGVGGDSTRLRTEAAAIGSCILAPRGEQAWPGNWRGVWVEFARDLSDLDGIVDRLLGDPAEQQRMARLSRWYFETNLRPEQMALRVLREVC